MRCGRVAAAVVGAMLAVASGAAAGKATTYGPSNGHGGYSEKEIEPGVWRVTSVGNAPAGFGFGRNMAIYRAAELLQAKGFAYVQVIDQKGKGSFMRQRASHYERYLGEFLKVTVRGANGPEAPTDCRAKDPKACFTLPTARVMARLAPSLGLAPQPAAQADAVMRAILAATDKPRPLSDCSAVTWADGTSACH